MLVINKYIIIGFCVDRRQICRGGDKQEGWAGGLGRGGSLAKCLRHTWQRTISLLFFLGAQMKESMAKKKENNMFLALSSLINIALRSTHYNQRANMANK